jgi:parvulin-like peptidyl-prolyl isomerase
MEKKILRSLFMSVWLMLNFSHPARAEKIDKIIAIVNSDVITEEELNVFAKLAAMEEDLSVYGKKPEEIKKALLDRLIEDRLILQEARQSGLKIDERLIDDRIKDVKEKAGSEVAFQEAMKAEGVNLIELKDKLRNQLMIYAIVQREVRSKVNVSPKEVTDYFGQHQDFFLTPETAVVDSIFVTTKEDLSKALAELSQGKDFAEVGRAYSKKSSLGSVGRGQLKKELEDFIFGLGVGQCSRPVAVEGGYYIFVVKERAAASTGSIDKVKNQIALRLEAEKMQDRMREWIESLKDKAYISLRE